MAIDQHQQKDSQRSRLLARASLCSLLGAVLLASQLAGSGTAAASAAAPGSLRVGLASSEITPLPGVPLAGHSGKTRLMSDAQRAEPQPYATRFMPSQGSRDPLRAKVMYLERDDGKLLLISLDVVAITRDLREAVHAHVKARGIGWDALIISATHTHSGPGTLSRNLLWNVLTMDRFNQTIYAGVVNQVLLAVDRAIDAAEPARLYSGSFQAQRGLQLNRANRPGLVDRQAELLLAKAASGNWLGGMLNLAVHGISMPAEVPLFSADLPGEIERRIEAGLGEQNVGGVKPTLLFMQAHSGDINPGARDEAAMVSHASRFADRAMAMVPQLEPLSSNWQIASGRYTIGRADINLPTCMAAGELPLEGWHAALAQRITYTPLSLFFPRRIWISTVRLGELVMFQWPGELTTELGLLLKALATRHGYRSAWILALSNNHLSYFTTPAEYLRPEYEACAAFTGPDGGTFVAGKHARHLQQLAGGQR